MGSAESIRVVAGIVRKQKRPVAVVVSAMTGVTNQLLESGKLALTSKMKESQKILEAIRVRHFTTIEELIVRDAKIADDTKRYVVKTLDTLAIFLDSLSGADRITPEAHDTILAVGERLSARLLAAYLTDLGVPSEQVDLERTIPGKFSVADGSFYVAAEKFFGTAFKKVLAKKKIPVGTGYFGRVPGGMLAAVGRGYSDFCGALAAAGLKADCYEIWTDVSGVFTADPRKIKKAKLVLETASGQKIMTYITGIDTSSQYYKFLKEYVPTDVDLSLVRKINVVIDTADLEGQNAEGTTVEMALV